MDTIVSLIDVDLPATFIVVCTILIGSKAVVSIWEWWISKLGVETKWQRNQKEEHELLEKTADNLKDFKEQYNKDMEGLSKKQDEDRRRLTEIQSSLDSSISDLKDKVETLSKQNVKYELADMRETLLSAYRYYANDHLNPRLEWTEMERHAFDEQFASYEFLGGNDFMHTVVEPEMAKLTVIQMSDVEAVSRLYGSRRHPKD